MQYTTFTSFFSFAFLVLCDAQHWFTLFDLNRYGRNNDNDFLAISTTKELFESCRLPILQPSDVESVSNDPFTYILVSNDISPLKIWLMRWGALSEEQQILAYKISMHKRAIKKSTLPGKSWVIHIGLVSVAQLFSSNWWCYIFHRGIYWHFFMTQQET